MLRTLLFTIILGCARANYASTVSETCWGGLWPAPSSADFGEQHIAIARYDIRLDVKGGCRGYIKAAFERFMRRSFRSGGDDPPTYTRYALPGVERQVATGIVVVSPTLFVTVNEPGEDACRSSCAYTCVDSPDHATLSVHTDESYTLAVEANGTMRIVAATHVGVVRGLSTLSQLIQWDGQQHVISCVSLSIRDKPTHAWRGLMIDTSRHFIPLEDLHRTVDGMENLKLNVFHWHIVDAQSFPYESKVKPLLSRRGAYHKTAVYTQADIRAFIEYAFQRGIRVVPEFDIPAHTASWGKGYPELTIPCPRLVNADRLGNIHMVEHGIDLVGMHPLKESTYTFLGEFLPEVFELFPDTYIHFGGDEVNKECWRKDPDVAAFAAKHGKQWASKLQWIFTERVLALASAAGKKPIFWDEALSTIPSDASIPDGTIIQWWRAGAKTVPSQVQRRGMHLVQSTGWYLDHVWIPWDKMYTTTHLSDFGGEACSWSEHQDASNIDDRIFRNVPALAERLWSSDDFTKMSRRNMRQTAHRFGIQLCRLRKRMGIRVRPAFPDFCGIAAVARNTADMTISDLTSSLIEARVKEWTWHAISTILASVVVCIVCAVMICRRRKKETHPLSDYI